MTQNHILLMSNHILNARRIKETNSTGELFKIVMCRLIITLLAIRLALLIGSLIFFQY